MGGGVRLGRLGPCAEKKTLGNYTHFLVYTASSLVEQSTPYALEIFDEFASAAWFRNGTLVKHGSCTLKGFKLWNQDESDEVCKIILLPDG